MSLKRLLKWHYFSVMTNEHVGKDSSGAVDRKNNYLPKWLNLQGNLQATLVSSSKGRDDVVKKYNLAEFETYYTIYHELPPETYDFGTNNRILIHKNPKLQITEAMIFSQDSLIRVYELIGVREPVALRTRLNLYEMYLRQVHRWSL
jgi:hypothetical protein